jgi:hypothetical protein
MDHPPLFPPGLHAVDESDLSARFVDAFASSTTRRPLLVGLQSFLNALRRAGVAFEVWLDGSFCTEKIDPNDIDLVVFADPIDLNRLDPAKQTYLSGVLDRTNARRQFGCDVLFAPSNDMNMRSYWRGWYGFDRRERPKGIVSLTVAP